MRRNESRDGGIAVTLEPELAKKLRFLHSATGLPMSRLAQAGLECLLPHLERGEWTVEDGKLRPARRPKKS